MKLEEEEDAIKYDALGNPIEIGSLYGYANNQNGINSVWLGFAKNLTKNGVTLNVSLHKSGAYGSLRVMEDTEYTKIPKTVNVKSVMLFPVAALLRNTWAGLR
jgi:hypothetical protein